MAYRTVTLAGQNDWQKFSSFANTVYNYSRASHIKNFRFLTSSRAKKKSGKLNVNIMQSNATEKIAPIPMCVTFVRLVIMGAIPARISHKRKND
jgi:hypothetical protein